MEEGRALLTPIVRDGGDQAPAVVIEVLSDLIASLDRPVPAAALAEQAARARRRASEFDDELANLLKAGHYLHLAGEWDKAREALGRALRQAQVVHSLLGQVRASQALGAAEQSLGRLASASAHYAQSVAAAETLGHAGPLVSSLVNQAELFELRRAHRQADEALETAAGHAAQSPLLAAEVRLRRAKLLAGRGESEAALEELSAAVETLKEEQAWQSIAEALAAAGRIHLDNGNWRDAVTEFAQAASVWAAVLEQGGDPADLARAKAEMAEALLDGGAVEDASGLFREARALAEEAGHRPLVLRAERGGLMCDLRLGAPDDIALALDRARVVDDPWVISEALVGLGDWEAARESAVAALAPEEDPPLERLPIRYALLVAVLLNNEDILGAWNAYIAGTVAQFQERLRGAGIGPARPPGGLSEALLETMTSLDARVAAADALLDQPLTPSVHALWRQRRRDLGARRHAWALDLAAARPAWASLLLHQAAPAAPGKPPAGEAWIAVLPGETEALAFVHSEGGLVAERLPALTDEAAGRKFWERVREVAPGATRFVLSPPPELVHLPWHELPGAPPASQLRYRPAAAPRAKPRDPDSPPPPDLPTDVLAVDMPTLLAAHLHGTTVVFDVPGDPSAVPALDAVIRAALYAGADAVKVRLPDGKGLLTYSR
jgi:tetratricopeptide (TPR) repeat protein